MLWPAGLDIVLEAKSRRCEVIVSHKHKFIFLKVAKTAGTSVEIALSQHCGEADVITPISVDDEQIRRDLGFPCARNYRIPLHRYSRADWKNLLRKRKTKMRFYNHMPAVEARRAVGEKVWNGYFKFCFERNPWDRTISQYFFRYRHEASRPSLSEFIESGNLERLKQTGSGIYSIDGRIAVDRVCFFENLEQELVEVCKGLPDHPGGLVLPRAKAGIRTDKRHYRELFSEPDRKAVAEFFADEIALFGYEF